MHAGGDACCLNPLSEPAALQIAAAPASDNVDLVANAFVTSQEVPPARMHM